MRVNRSTVGYALAFLVLFFSSPLFRSSVTAIALVGGLAVIAVVGVWGTVVGIRNHHSRDRLATAPRVFNSTAAEIREWIPQCSFIVEDEANMSGAFGFFSFSSRARRKSLGLIAKAKTNADAMRRHDLSQRAYVACAEIERLQRACLRCRSLNRGKRQTRCVIQENSDFAVDLEFHNNGEE